MFGAENFKSNVFSCCLMVFKKIFIYFAGLSFAVALSLLMLSLHNGPATFESAHAQAIKDQELSLNPVYSGFSSPTGIAFLNDSGNHALVIEKKGSVKLISNGVVSPDSIMTFNVDTKVERGLLGVDVMKKNGITYVFFYITENLAGSSSSASDELRNRVYGFQWTGNGLTNQKLLLDLPAIPGPNHNAGKITIGKDGNLYTVVGDLNHETKLQNFADGGEPDLTGSIYRINPLDGSALPDNPFVGSNVPNLEKTFAYGLRNSFGLTTDPVTGNIWDTENGPSFSDEINIVNPGFNSGWKSVMGPISSSDKTEADLVQFPNSKYHDPQVSWPDPIAVTDIEFINTPLLGAKYQNNILVGDYLNGNLYFFKVRGDRTALDVTDALIDTPAEMDAYTLGTGFGGITDIKTGPDGKVYVVSYKTGDIYTIS